MGGSRVIAAARPPGNHPATAGRLSGNLSGAFPAICLAPFRRGGPRAITAPAMLHINDLTYRIAGRPLFEGATVAIDKGERVGLIGRNGSGKTTLLRLIGGELQADGGAISLPRTQRIGRVAQEAPSGPESLLETVLAADL